jgi:hypothetical protein
MRGTGLTKEEVRRLKPGDVYVVHNGPMVRYVTDMIASLHGRGFVGRVKVLMVNRPEHVMQLRGYRIDQVHIDHAVYPLVDNMTFEVLATALRHLAPSLPEVDAS